MKEDTIGHNFAKVAFELKIGKKLEYEIPEELRPKVRVGTKVWAPLGKSKQVGYIVEFIDKPSYSPLKKITGLVATGLEVPDNIMSLARWMAEYYCTDIGLVMKSVVPAAVRKESSKFRYVTVIRRSITIEKMREECVRLRNSAPRKSAVLEPMLKVEGSIRLQELCDVSCATSTVVNKLVKDGFLTSERIREDRDIFRGEVFLRTESKKLTPQQKEVFNRISADIDEKKHAVHLIHGITSSGKTEVYLQLMDRVIKDGRTAIILVPEISLTPQTIERFKSRFGDVVSVLHHRLSEGERHDEWHRLRESKTLIAIGARSAVFAPLHNLGLIIIDEEHESSYKQADIAPTYNARDIAVVRSKMENAVVVLGSATPSLESYHNAVKGKYILSELTERIDNRPLPEMKVVDMTRSSPESGDTVLSTVLINAIGERLRKGEQVILFLNRRGFATILICRGCKAVMMCPNCSIPLKFHKEENRLLCHLCTYASPVPRVCPSCNSETVLQKGFGTEKIERMLYKVFPEINVLRMDADTTRKKWSHDEILREFKAGKAQVLVGTQMIAKGLHFPNVTLVGIVSADTSLYVQDFRASENTFQLITQVSGRAGRGEMPGEVIIQTSVPEHYAIRAACHNSYSEFYEREIESRRVFHYPPFLRMVCVTLHGKDGDKTHNASKELVRELNEKPNPGIEILGPTEAPIRKLRGDFRFQIFLKSTRVSAMTHLVSACLSRVKFPSSIRASVDVDPVDML